MIEFQEELFSEVLSDLYPLFEESYREAIGDGEFNLDLNFYDTLQSIDMISTVVARDEGKVVGYVVSIIGRNPKKKHKITSTVDSIYIVPSHRSPKLLRKLLQFAEKDYISRGVSEMFLSLPASLSNTATERWLRLNHIEHNFFKEI